MSTRAESPPVRAAVRIPVRFLWSLVALAAAYVAIAKIGQALRYTGSVSAIWPPVGLGIAALYLWGFALWPAIFVGDLIVNAELYIHNSIPVGSLIGQQAGNMLEIVGGAFLLRRLIGPRASFERTSEVTGMVFAVGIATALSATVGTLSMLAGGVIEHHEVPTFFRTWWLGDFSGGLVILPLIVVWARNPRAACRQFGSWAGAFLVAFVLALAFVAVSTTATVTYIVFPALIWAAYRFRAPGATVAVFITAAVTIGMTAHHLGAFSSQQINNRTLSTQLYIAIAALTTLYLSAIVSERERFVTALEDAKRREGERAVEERYRIARDLHDSVSQALFSAVLQIRTAQKALAADRSDRATLAKSLRTIAALTRGAQMEMRALIFELRRNSMDGGLMRAVTRHVDRLNSSADDGLTIDVGGSTAPLPVSHYVETQLFAIVREALANVTRHARARRASVRIVSRPDVVIVDVGDDGCGFEPNADRPGHYGLESIRGRAAEIGGFVTIASEPGSGTAVRVEVPIRSRRVDGD